MPSQQRALTHNEFVDPGETASPCADSGRMNLTIGPIRQIGTLLLILPLSSCAASGANSYVLVGAYFPAWMLCSMAGVLGAICTRIVMVASGLSEFLPFQLFVCAALGLIIAAATWLLWFGR